MRFMKWFYHKVLRVLGIEQVPPISAMVTTTLANHADEFGQDALKNNALLHRLKQGNDDEAPQSISPSV